MARMPGAVWEPLPENTTEPPITATQVVLHSVVGAGNPRAHFNRGGNQLESHFWVVLDGTVHQFIDTARQADAQRDGNVRAISVETADHGDPDHDPWTPAQIEAMASIIVWAHRTHGVPVRRCRTWTDPGVGYHTMWGAPSHWTPVAKTCPGAARIRQFEAVLGLALSMVREQEEDDVMALTKEELTEAVENGVFAALTRGANGRGQSVAVFEQTQADEIRGLAARLDRLIELLTPAAGTGE